MRVCLWGLVISMWKPNCIRYVLTNGSLMGSGRNFVYYWPSRIVGYLMLMGQRSGREPMVLYGLGMCCNKTRACFELIWDRLNRPIQFLLVLNVLGQSPNVNFRCFQSDYSARAGVRGARTSVGNLFKGPPSWGFHMVGCMREAVELANTLGNHLESMQTVSNTLDEEMVDGRGISVEVGGLREWEKLCLTPMHISWPKPWCLAKPDPIQWDDIMSSVTRIWERVPGDATGEPCRLRFQESIENVGAIQCNFFSDHVAVVDCLAKWFGSHNLNDHEARRKQDGASHQQTSQGLGAEQDQDTGQKRKFLRVRPSKSRKQDNTWVCDKVNFSQELPAMMSISPLGFNEFRVGKDMGQDAGETQPTWKSRKTRLDILKKEIAKKEARLEEIASNIIATDTNSALRNSILKMKGSKLVKFSAKLNAEGVACIDENMIEAEREQSMEQPSNNGFNGNGQHMHNRNVNNAGVFGHPNNRTQGNIYRERHPKPITTYERNIVNPKRQGMIPDKDGQHVENKIPGGDVKLCGNSTSSSIGVQAAGDTGTVPNEKQKPSRTAQVHVIETRNSFQLLDAEGNFMTDDAMVNNTVNSGGNQSQEVNGNWQRKQERVLNTRFRNSLTQDQRFEAKRFVLDKLVPLDSSLSEWSTQLLEYFRHLCSIYEFGDGYSAASRDRIRSMGREETVSEEDMEDVDSETDGTATMMKLDTTTLRPENGPMDSIFEGVSENTHQADIVGAGNNLGTC
ncbi:hypothetical protein L1987_35563 [Smallanthus sonchifolius]|uniref:Uncharacterized protein n=1 Tax=Smallanthus sonchifolius TaxID=185202 RepID=A0ACB9HB60_9ASTR|nr:hypothetical protein L1987_35563 [Smallanthus sonchifolius]